jgi:hypothetical protein
MTHPSSKISPQAATAGFPKGVFRQNYFHEKSVLAREKTNKHPAPQVITHRPLFAPHAHDAPPDTIAHSTTQYPRTEADMRPFASSRTSSHRRFPHETLRRPTNALHARRGHASNFPRHASPKQDHFPAPLPRLIHVDKHRTQTCQKPAFSALAQYLSDFHVRPVAV